MSTGEVLSHICDFSHNYKGCYSLTDSFLLVDRIVALIYSILIIYTLHNLWKRKKYQFDTPNIILSILLTSFIFRISHVSIISSSFSLAVFLHYFYLVTHLSAIALSIGTPNNIAKMVKVAEILPSSKLASFYVVFINLGSLLLVTISNIVTVFLFALDSSDTEKYRTYHFMQYVGTPLYMLLVLSPVLIYIRASHSWFDKLIAKKSNVVLSDESVVLSPTDSILPALNELYYVGGYALLSIILASFTMIMDLVAISVDAEGVLVAKILSEFSSLSVNIILLFLLINENPKQRRQGFKLSRQGIKQTAAAKAKIPGPNDLKGKIANAAKQDRDTIVLSRE